MIQVTRHPDSRLVEFTVDGLVTQAELKSALEETKAAMAGGGKYRLLEYIRSFEGITPAAMWTDMTEALPMIGDVERVAVVTDEAWIRATTQAAGVLPFLDIRAYPTAEIEAARSWLAQP